MIYKNWIEVAIGVHPYILHTQMFLRNIGVRPIFYLNYFNDVK